MSDFFVGLMSEADIRRFWPDIAISLDSVPRFEQLMTKDFLLEKALAGDVQFWAAGREKVVEIFAATRVVNYPTRKVLQVVTMVGRNLDVYWEEGLRQLDRVAAQLLCDEVEVEMARMGLARKLEREGYEIQAITLTKTVEKGSVH